MPISLIGYTDKQIRVRLETLSGHLANYRKTSNPDGLRLIRVWARRSSVAMKLFESHYGNREFKLLLDELKTVVHDLGAERDKLILKDLVEGSFSVLTDGEKEGAASLLQLKVISNELSDPIEAKRQLKRILKIDLLKQFDSLAERADRKNEKKRADRSHCFFALPEADNASELLEMAREVLREELDAVLKAAGCLDNPNKIAELHQLRICVKKLRYTIDLMLPAIESVADLHDSFAALHEKLRELQDSIGAIHDMDFVLHGLLDTLAKEAAQKCAAAIGFPKQKTAKYMSYDAGIGILKIAADIQLKRDSLFRQFCSAWKDNQTVSIFRLSANSLPKRSRK